MKETEEKKKDRPILFCANAIFVLHSRAYLHIHLIIEFKRARVCVQCSVAVFDV